jgi:hypothetical protein
VPTFNYDHSLRHWRVYLSKSEIQRWGQWGSKSMEQN